MVLCGRKSEVTCAVDNGPGRTAPVFLVGCRVRAWWGEMSLIFAQKSSTFGPPCVGVTGDWWWNSCVPWLVASLVPGSQVF